MMSFYIGDIGYYEGQRRTAECEEVQERPSHLHQWVAGAWVNGVAPAKVMTSLAFIELFTPEEQLAVVTAAMQSPELRLWYDKLMAADQVVFDDPRLLEGMSALVSHGLIAAERRNEILS